MKALGELLESFALYAVCDTCRRTAPVDLTLLIDKYGPEYLIDDVRQRLFCNTCKVRTQALRIVYIGPQGRAKSFRYAR